ncbi:AraC family transcriptional regulator [Seleniivibrio woodruffii]|uniref:AraC family transcriptional regulator n=1 Tax=Seleniivibrio woodruffii TaxID=1078050 RepID=UPI0026F1C17D|nr:AraC family transcriptional regulator [Seleniivibrio woodruffii]
MTEVSGITFQYVLKALEANAGVAVDEMLEFLGLDGSVFRNEKIDGGHLPAVFRYCMEKTGNPHLALDIGQSIPYQSLGLLGYLLLNTPTLKQMIEKFSRYQQLISSLLKFHFADDGKYYKFAVYINENMNIPVPAHHAEVHLSAVLNILSQILGQKVVPAYVFFSRKRVRDCAMYHELFGEHLFFEKEENAVFFKKDELNIPVSNANRTMLEYFEAQANAILSEMGNSSWFNRAEKEILKNIGDRNVTIELVAGGLKVGVRTLQNYLKNEGKSFSQALANVRRSLAEHYIRNTRLTDSEISALLGYSEVSAFYRAYKKWNFDTPKKLRREV